MGITSYEERTADRLTELERRFEALIVQDRPGSKKFGVGRIPFGGSTGILTDDANFVWDNTNDRLGIGTSAPNTKIDVRGTNNSYGAGPHIDFTTDVDAYPEFQILAYTHDNMELTFDAYFNGTNWISSDVGSNYQIRKNGDRFSIWAEDAITAGSVVTWTEILGLNYRGLHETTYTDGGTNTAPVIVQYSRRTTAALSSIAANFGMQTNWLLDTTTTAEQNAAADIVSWSNPTHASRTSLRRFFVYDSGGSREFMRAEGSGTAAMIGFFGVAAVARQVGGAATADLTYSANERDMLNTLWTMARNYGLLT